MADAGASRDLDDRAGLPSYAGGESSMVDGKAVHTHELVTIASLGVGVQPGMHNQVKDESKMGVSSSFMLKPAAQASPMAADASPMASFDGAFTTAASSQAPPPAPVTRGNRRIFTPLAANPALPDEDVAPEAGPTAGGHSSAAPLPGELGASWYSDPASPRAHSPVSGKGPVAPMFPGAGGYSGSVGMPGAEPAGHSGTNGGATNGMPVNSNSLRSPTALEAASQEAIAQSRIAHGVGNSGGFIGVNIDNNMNNMDVYFGRGGGVGGAGGVANETPRSPGMYSTVGSRGGPDPTTELSSLISRAKQLMGVIDRNRGGSVGGSEGGTTRLLQNNPAFSPMASAATKGAFHPNNAGNLHTVAEHDEEAEALDNKLGEAKGSLAAAYAALNRNYDEVRKTGVIHNNPLSDVARSYAESAAGSVENKKLISARSTTSGGTKGQYGGNGMGKFLETEDLEKLNMLAAAQKVAAYHVQQSSLLTVAQHKEAVRKETVSRKRVRISVWPMLLYVSFILAAGYYFYARIVWGMGGLTPGLRSYSYFVLFVEILGAINMLFYACWLFARPVNTDVFPPVNEKGQLPPLRRKYTIRVLIPCYKESLAITQRTVLAARRADKPAGTRVIIYICDDGADEAKSDWVSSLNDRDVIYITGRDKTQKSKNGKSANLNNTLQLIYPEIRDPYNNDEFMKIPIHELMCLFDADQTCSKGFFTTLMRYIDSGDDVGVALSPQLMFNVVPDCDIFNHQNVHFWEMMQPGMDALGFISLTGTNMIIRSRALCEAGWFPMNSVTEDWALGMRLKKLGWRCRYVDKYLVIGEAPDVTRQAFQQRSRWCKGHFQVFWSEECPLFDSRLNLFHRVAYSSTCASYLSTALSVPVLNLVPILTILFGWFPIALNATTVIGITLYYISLNMLSFYCLSWSHMKALWLSNMSSVILFYPYLKASFATPVKQVLGATMEFKTTLKGAGRGGLDLKVYGVPVFIICANVVTFIIGAVTLDAQINAAKGISLCWIVFNTVPHVLLLLNSYFGPGYIMSAICKVCMALTSVAGVLAIVLMWLLYPREVDWLPTLDASITFMQAQMSGALPPDHRVDWRSDSGMQYKSIVITSRGIRSNFKPYENPNMPSFNTTLDLSRGFYEDGPWGPVKLTKNNGLSTAMLAWAMLDAKETFEESRDLTQQSLNVVQHGLEYLKACYIPDPTDYGVQYGDVYVYQVGDIKFERRLWRRPEDVTGPQPVYITAGIEQPTDLVAHMVAGIVSASLALHEYGRISRIEAIDNVKFVQDMYNVTMDTEGVLKHYRSLWRSDSFYDDKLWAASWMYRAALTSYDDPSKAQEYFEHMQDSYYNAIGEEDTFVTDLDYVLNLGIVHAAVNSFSYEWQTPAQTLVWDWICSGHPEVTGLGRVLAEDSPFLGDTVMVAALAQIYSNKMKYFDKMKKGFKRGFQCFAQNQARYLIGTDWNRKSYVVGMGKKGYDHTVHRGASCPAWPAECPPNMRGSNKKDHNVNYGGVLWLPELTDNPKNTRGGNNTAVSLMNNAGLPLLMASLQQSDITWLQCLQNSGAFLPHPVCKSKRPIPVERMGRAERRRFWGYDFALEELDENDSLEQTPPGVATLPLTRDIGTALPEFKVDDRRFEYDLSELVGKGWLFYEAQRSGKLPADNKIPWRADSYVNDGSLHAPPLDLEGGWYDAGDYLKISFSFCTAVWRLAWNMLSYKDVLEGTTFQENDNFANGVRQLEWAAKYLRKLRIRTPAGQPDQFVVQVGDYRNDHPIIYNQPYVAEAITDGTGRQNMTRPVYVLNTKTNGSDLIGEAVAAYASLSILFEKIDPQLSVALEDDAFTMYELMNDMTNTKYSEAAPNAYKLYPSNVPLGHEFLANAWMYRMTSDPKYLQTAQAVHAQAGALYHNPVIGWSNPMQEARLVLEEFDPNAAMLQGVQLWLNAHMFGKDASYTRKGMWYASQWGTLRNAALMAGVALRAAHIMDNRADGNGEVVNVVWAHHARCFARQQMNYIMGSAGHSFVTNWGFQPPEQPHHRGASCGYVVEDEDCDYETWLEREEFPNTLTGALVGGPNLFDEWKDDHLDFVASEVAIDYNAGLLSGAIGMMRLPAYFWQTTDHCPTFPMAEVDFAEAFYKPIPGIKLTRDHPSVLQ